MAILNNLIVHGRSRFLNGINANTINAKSIGANKGVFNELIATTLNVETATIDDLTAQNATVVGLLDVRGELKTNTWSNSNIATIEGNFFIAPTLASGTGETLVSGLTISFASNNWTITITGTFDLNQIGADPVDSSDTATNQWSVGSKVLITGEIGKTDGIYPLGTLMGEIQSASPSSFTITKVTDNLGKTDILSTLGTGTYQYRNVKISLTQRKYGSSSTASDNMRPIGILMSAQGRSSKSFIDIYGGANNLRSGAISGATTDFGGLAIPNVRIGNLRGLPNVVSGDFTQNESLPTGWGIYTDNGYFKGTIVSTSGKIGNFTLGTAIYGAASGAGPSSISATTAGTYLGTDGFRSNKSGDTTKYVQITDGIITAKGANITGTVDATSFTAKYYDSSNILQRQIALDAFGLKIMDGASPTPNILSKFGTTSTIGRDSGDNYNIDITGTAIDLRYNTSILNRINNSGMTLYDGNGIADSNKIASFGNTVTIGKQNVSQLVLSSGSIEGIGQNGLSYFMVNNDGANSVTFEYAKNYGPYTIASGSNRSVSISTTTSSLSSGTYFEIKTIVNNADKTVKFKKGTASTRILYGTVIEGAYDGANTIVITNNAAGSRSVHIYTYIEVIGSKTVAYQFGEAKENVEFGAYAFLSGVNTEASGNYTHVEGHSTTANGDYAHAEGYSTTASGYASHAEGESTTIAVDTFYGHAEGSSTVVSGTYAAHAEGGNTTASGNFAHAEGVNSEASGYASHAEGSSDASGRYAHAEGGSTASGMAAHSEGVSTYAVGLGSHAGGTYSYANHDYSFVHGTDLISGYENQAVFGRYNKITIPTKTYLLYSCSASDEGQTKLSIDYSQWHFYLGDVAIYYNGDPFDHFTYDSQYIYINRVNTPDGDFYEGDEIEARVVVNDKAFIIGNGSGSSSSARSNALTVDWNGNVIGQAMAGIIQMFAGSTPPTGWLVCDGTSYLRSDYPTLFEALGGTSSPWGLPDSTHFNVPDLRGRAPIGTNTVLNNANTSARLIGDTGGNEDLIIPYHNHSVNSVPIGSSGGHSHTITNKYTNGQLASGSNSPRFRTDGNTNTTNFSSIASNTGTHTHSVPSHNTNYAGTSGNEVGANMMPYAVVNFIICTGKTS